MHSIHLLYQYHNYLSKLLKWYCGLKLYGILLPSLCSLELNWALCSDIPSEKFMPKPILHNLLLPRRNVISAFSSGCFKQQVRTCLKHVCLALRFARDTLFEKSQLQSNHFIAVFEIWLVFKPWFLTIVNCWQNTWVSVFVRSGLRNTWHLSRGRERRSGDKKRSRGSLQLRYRNEL